jgi:hypothetical protein
MKALHSLFLKVLRQGTNLKRLAVQIGQLQILELLTKVALQPFQADIVTTMENFMVLGVSLYGGVLPRIQPMAAMH